MITESLMNEAIQAVKLEGVDAIADIAADYGIKPEVLRARVEKAYGSVDALAARAATDAAVAERHEAERAAKVAAGIARLESMFVVMRDHPLKGTEFTFDGERYVFVLLSASHPTYYARCVRLSDGGIVGVNKPVFNKVIVPAAHIATKKAA